MIWPVDKDLFNFLLEFSNLHSLGVAYFKKTQEIVEFTFHIRNSIENTFIYKFIFVASDLKLKYYKSEKYNFSSFYTK